MKLYADDDPNYSRPPSVQSVSIKTMKDKQSLPTLISGSVIKSNAVTVKMSDNNKQTPLLHDSTDTYNQIKDSNKDQVIN